MLPVDEPAIYECYIRLEVKLSYVSTASKDKGKDRQYVLINHEMALFPPRRKFVPSNHHPLQNGKECFCGRIYARIIGILSILSRLLCPHYFVFPWAGATTPPFSRELHNSSYAQTSKPQGFSINYEYSPQLYAPL